MRSASGATELSHLPYVDGLRAIAIATVVLYHAWPQMMPGGFIGVDVFFVISGFLITRIIANEMVYGDFSFVRFLARRVRRLVPASVVMFGAVLVAGMLILRPDALKSVGQSLAYTSVILANVHFYRTGGYFSAPPEEKPLLHMWSLAVEDQFYLTWPLLLLLLTAYLTRRWTIVVVVALCFASLAFAQFKLATDPDYAFYMLTARAWELLAGCLLALSIPHISLKGSAAAVTSWAGVFLIAASALLLSPSTPFPGVTAVPAVIGTVAVIVAGLQSSNIVTRTLSTRPVVFVGLISYSLYLWHWPILSLSQYALGRPLSIGETSVAIAASLGSAIISWQYVEQPFRRPSGVVRDGDWRSVAIGFGVLAATFIAGGLLKVFNGLPARFDGSLGAIYSDMSRGNPMRPLCDGTDRIFGTDDVCAFGRKFEPGATYEVAVFGDSNADHFVPGIAEWARARKLLTRQVTNSDCALIFNVNQPRLWPAQAHECQEYRRTAKRFIEQNANLKLAILGGAWRDYLDVHDNPNVQTPELMSPTWKGAQPDQAKGFEIALGRTVDYFLSRGIKVLLLAQIPEFEILPTTCIARAVVAGRETHLCGISLQQYNSMNGNIDAALMHIAASRHGVSVSFPSRLICDETYCSPYRDGTFIYRNRNHLSYAGSLKMREMLNLP